MEHQQNKSQGQSAIGANAQVQAAAEQNALQADASLLPVWLCTQEHYEPVSDADGFVSKSMLSLVAALKRLRLDDGQSLAISASAPVKLLFGLGCILLTSLSKNYFFILLMLAGTLCRTALLPARGLRRTVTTALTAAIFTALVMLPAILLGQTQTALLVGTKVLVSVGIALCTSLSIPAYELTGALRSLHVPNLAIMTLDLALKSIVSLGQVADEVLCALCLRSVGKNKKKGAALGGVGGVVLLKASEAAHDTSDAMRCRGFEGEYRIPEARSFRPQDVLWCVVFVLLVLAFIYFEGVL